MVFLRETISQWINFPSAFFQFQPVPYRDGTRNAASQHKRMVVILHIGFIGAGKVGFTLGKYFAVHGLPVLGYYSRSKASAEKAAEFTNTQAFDTLETLVSQCGILFLTVPDRCIPQVYGELTKLPIEKKCLCHCSGALSAHSAFPGIQDLGAFGYSIHPLFAVSDCYHAYKELPDVFFTIEGDPAHFTDLQNMLTGIGLHVQPIPPECKTIYHTAAAIASNLMVALAAQSMDMLQTCGFSPQDAQNALAPLMLGNMQHIAAEGVTASLTGPVERGDTNTVRKHLDALTDPTERQIYRLLSRRLIPLAQHKHPERDYQQMEQLLKGD